MAINEVSNRRAAWSVRKDGRTGLVASRDPLQQNFSDIGPDG